MNILMVLTFVTVMIRKKLKSLPEMGRLAVLAKVPECVTRSGCVLASLIRI